MWNDFSRVITAPIVAVPDASQRFIIYHKASKKELICVFMQNKRVITISWQLKLYKQNYPTHDLKLATLVFVLKI